MVSPSELWPAGVGMLHEFFHNTLKGKHAQLSNKREVFKPKGDCSVLCEQPCASGKHVVVFRAVAIGSGGRQCSFGMSDPTGKFRRKPGVLPGSYALTTWGTWLHGEGYDHDKRYPELPSNWVKAGDTVRMQFDAETCVLTIFCNGHVVGATGEVKRGWHFSCCSNIGPVHVNDGPVHVAIAKPVPSASEFWPLGVGMLHEFFHNTLKGTHAQLSNEREMFKSTGNCSVLCEHPCTSGKHVVEFRAVAIGSEGEQCSFGMSHPSGELGRSPGLGPGSYGLTTGGKWGNGKGYDHDERYPELPTNWVKAGDTVRIPTNWVKAGDTVRMQFDAETCVLTIFCNGHVVGATSEVRRGWHFSCGSNIGPVHVAIAKPVPTASEFWPLGVGMLHEFFHNTLKGKHAQLSNEREVFKATGDCSVLCEQPCTSGKHVVEFRAVTIGSGREPQCSFGMSDPSGEFGRSPGLGPGSYGLSEEGKWWHGKGYDHDDRYPLLPTHWVQAGDTVRMQFDAETCVLTIFCNGHVVGATGEVKRGWHFSCGRNQGEMHVNMSSVFVFLNLTNLASFFDAFIQNGYISITMLKEMDSEELRQVGLKAGHVKSFMAGIRKLTPSFQAPPMSPNAFNLASAASLTLADAAVRVFAQEGVLRLFAKTAGPNFVATRAQIASCPAALVSSVSNYMDMLDIRREHGDVFNPTEIAGQQQKSDLIAYLKSLFSTSELFPGKVYRKANALLCWHGVKTESTARDICATGFAPLSELDPGYHGNGRYLSPEAEYAAMYSNGQLMAGFNAPNADGDWCVLLCMGVVGMVWPITPCTEDYAQIPPTMASHCKFFGKPIKPKYDTHFVAVAPPAWLAVDPQLPQQNQFHEVVFSQDSQILPLAIVWFKRRHAS